MTRDSKTDGTGTRTLYLVDGTSQLFRAFYAIRGLTTPDGMPSNAVYGFTTMLRKLIKEERPGYLAVAFDLGSETFRHEEYEDYKANRDETPDELHVQTPYAKKVCEVLRIPVLELANYEADDLIATMTRQAREEGFEVVVVASDKDLLQLVREGVRVLNPSKNVMLDEGAVEESFGVRPDLVLDVQGLMGDSVDNIPGVPGVGEKTAKSIVSRYGDLESVIERAGRFVAAYDARDALLKSIAALEKEKPASKPTLAQVAKRADRFAERLGRLIEIEADPELRPRLEETARELDQVDAGGLPSLAGEPGREAAKGLKKLKAALKGLDRKSAKRVWYSIRENEEQARLSRRLATLHEQAPVEFDAGALAVGPADREGARELFGSLGFRSLSEEFVGSEEGVEDEATEKGRDDAGVDHGYETVLTRKKLERLAASCRETGRFAIHALADGADPMRASLIGLSLSPQAGQGAYVPLAHDYLGAPRQLSLDATREILAPLLADTGMGRLGHDVKRESHLLRRHGMPVRDWELDTEVGAFLLSSGSPSFDRERLAAELLGFTALERDALTGTGAKRKPFGEIEVERVSEYAAESAEITLRLADVVETKLKESGLIELYRTVDGPLLPLLARMEARGIRVDAGLLSGMSREMQDSLDLLTLEIHSLAGTEFNVDSPKQLREVLFDKLGLKPKRKTAKSKVASTDAQTLELLAEEHDVVRKIMEYRELAKLKGTYVDTLPELIHPETGRVHTRFNPTGAATGRLSSSDPNLQNIPARTAAGLKIRAAFVPDPGHLFLASDYSQIELRLLAHLSRDPELIRAFREGEDIHRHTAALVGGVHPELVTGDMRRRAKAVNFGILYGMSETRLAREQKMSRTEAREFIRAYFDRFPAVRTYIDETRDLARREGAVRTLLGRVRHFPQLHQRVNRAVQEQALRAAVNTTLQGTAADLMKRAMLRVDAALAKAGLKTQILLQVHDELLLEVPEKEIRAVEKLVAEAMEAVHALDVPLVVDHKTGASWAEVT